MYHVANKFVESVANVFQFGTIPQQNNTLAGQLSDGQE